jgi:hypothetical protein
MTSALSIFAPAGAFGLPVSHGSKTIRLPPGVVTAKVVSVPGDREVGHGR